MLTEIESCDVPKNGQVRLATVSFLSTSEEPSSTGVSIWSPKLVLNGKNSSIVRKKSDQNVKG